jgi:NADPH:quinone reductase-like Zn-dependent oxidoreductase
LAYQHVGAVPSEDACLTLSTGAIWRSAGGTLLLSSFLILGVRMNIDPSGKQALVTGSTAGIGSAAVFRLARLGASVIVNGRMHARVDRAMRGIQDDIADAKVTGIAADLAMLDGVAHATKTYLA